MKISPENAVQGTLPRRKCRGGIEARTPPWSGSIMEKNQVVDFYGGRCRIRTCDFHRVKMALYR
jgi:hypothetical protein